jgi:hypothetical protein
MVKLQLRESHCLPINMYSLIWRVCHFQMLNFMMSIAGGTLYIVEYLAIVSGNQLAI